LSRKQKTKLKLQKRERLKNNWQMRTVMAPTEWSPRFAFLGNYAVLAFFNVLFVTLLPQEILSLITHSWEELLGIRATSIYLD
jgi:hypothetical protein